MLGCAWLCVGYAGPSAQLPKLDTELIAAERRRQQIDQMRDYHAQRAHVDTVAYRIGEANRSACAEQVTVRIGLTAATAQSLPSNYCSYARDALVISWIRPTVIAVVAGSQAAAAGIGTGDEILHLQQCTHSADCHHELDRRPAETQRHAPGHRRAAARRQRPDENALSRRRL